MNANERETNVRMLIVWVLLVLISAGCHKAESPATKSVAPAQVPHPVKEESLAGVILTPEAEGRLGIVTVAAALKPVTRSRTYGAEVLLPLQQTSTNASTGVAQNESIFSLFPALTPTEIIKVSEMQVDADGQIAAAQVQLEGAQVALRRTQNLLAEKAASARAVDEAKVQVALAEAALKTAQQRRQLLGAPIFQAVQGKAVWLRVPVYAGSVREIDAAAPAVIRSLGNFTNEAALSARPLSLPVSSSTGSAMGDLYYQAENPDGAIRPGQRVSVELKLRGREQAMTVPSAALLFDVNGGAWVYEKTAPHGFTRRRVQVQSIQDNEAIIAGALQAGAQVVTAGAAELFGTEMGFAK